MANPEATETECERLRTLLHEAEAQRDALANRILSMFPDQGGRHPDAARRLAQMVRDDLLRRVRQATGAEGEGDG